MREYRNTSSGLLRTVNVIPGNARKFMERYPVALHPGLELRLELLERGRLWTDDYILLWRRRVCLMAFVYDA